MHWPPRLSKCINFATKFRTVFDFSGSLSKFFLYFLILLFSIITKYNFNHCAAILGPYNAPYYNLKFVIVYVFEQIIGNVFGYRLINRIPFFFVAYCTRHLVSYTFIA